MGFYCGRKSIKEELIINNDDYITISINVKTIYGTQYRMNKQYTAKQEYSTSNLFRSDFSKSRTKKFLLRNSEQSEPMHILAIALYLIFI